ncbi:hypothetical protein Ple7327_3688 [Pleurocapsa sp. PCC 7327]|uniref:hypothetical protein n=1 Tax=Pleurocapsa sp. PCC 7327 TaxID=118163 RepID=UPI00029FF1BE|nr:hypothetical protein [Pleurocapsa sp. PCC 7327]AFY78878.1 hypothetical protein Ple7327_3688 [Pleurocapsa sp. PCC 7327]
MQQTALNLIAIGVFIITLSSLLGPILNISPVIPAATTLGIMGLATLDNLTWNGKATTLFLDLFSSPQQRQRVVHHEAGHFLVAYFLGIPVVGYTLSAWEAFKEGQPGLGGVVFDTNLLEKSADLREAPIILERFCTVWMAGIAAETIVYGNVEGGESDRENLREVLRFVGLPESVYPQKERWAYLQAKSLLEKHQKSYEALVQAMEKRASVEECLQAIGRNAQG